MTHQSAITFGSNGFVTSIIDGNLSEKVKECYWSGIPMDSDINLFVNSFALMEHFDSCSEN